eukprot:gene18780-25320_t
MPPGPLDRFSSETQDRHRGTPRHGMESGCRVIRHGQVIMPSSQAIPPLNSPRIAPSRPSVTLGRALSEASNAQLAVMRSTFSDWTQKRGLQSYHCQNLCDEAKAEIRELFDCLTRRNRADLDLLCLASAVDTILEKGKYKFSGLKDIFRDMEAKERTGKVDFHKFRAYMSLLYDCPEGPSPTHHASAVMTKQQGLPGMILLVSGEHVKILDVLRSYSRRSFLADVQMQTERVQTERVQAMLDGFDRFFSSMLI